MMSFSLATMLSLTVRSSVVTVKVMCRWRCMRQALHLGLLYEAGCGGASWWYVRWLCVGGEAWEADHAALGHLATIIARPATPPQKKRAMLLCVSGSMFGGVVRDVANATRRSASVWACVRLREPNVSRMTAPNDMGPSG